MYLLSSYFNIQLWRDIGSVLGYSYSKKTKQNKILLTGLTVFRTHTKKKVCCRAHAYHATFVSHGFLCYSTLKKKFVLCIFRCLYFGLALRARQDTAQLIKIDIDTKQQNI